MKYILKKTLWLGVILMSILLLGIFIQSCTSGIEDQLSVIDDNLKCDYVIEATKETDILKAGIKNQMQDLKSIIDNNKAQLINLKSTDIQIEAKLSDIMVELSSKSLNMLASYGYNYSDIEQYVDNENDPRIAVMGIVFLHLIEQEINPHKNIIRLKSSTEEEGFSYGQVLDCLGRVFIGVNVSEFIAGTASRITLSTALSIAGRVAVRTVGVALTGIAVAEFGDCMGWYDLW